MDPDRPTLLQGRHIEVSARDTPTVSTVTDNIIENSDSDHTGSERVDQLTCDCERVNQLTCNHNIMSYPSGDNLTLDTLRDKIAGGYGADKLARDMYVTMVTDECWDSLPRRRALEQGATDNPDERTEMCSNVDTDDCRETQGNVDTDDCRETQGNVDTDDCRETQGSDDCRETQGNLATAGVLTSQGMNTRITEDSDKPLFESKQDNTGAEEDHSQIDVYDISESDENSQPSVTLPKRRKLLHGRVASGNPGVAACPDRRVCGSLSESSRSRVVYMHSDVYVQTCSEMLRVPGRAAMVHSLIEAYGLLKYLKVVPPREATTAEILQFHTSDYIEVLEKISKQEDEEKYDSEAEQFGLTYDCPVHIGVYNYAVLVAGATIQAAELLMDGSCDMAINWGGGWHHGKKDAASGFCYINDVVLGILTLREKYERVLYIDLDLHHGDGVEDAFCATSKVLTLSFHKYQAGFFPGSGAVQDIGVSRGRHYSVNVPLVDGIKDPEFCALFNRVVSRVHENFQPEVVVCQCGADGLAGDPMESFNLTPLGLGRCLHILQGWKKPLLLLGGGGYNPVNTAKCWTFLTALAVGKKLNSDIPDNQFFTEYGPDYELSVSMGNRKDSNSREYLQTVYRQVMENIGHISC